MIVINGYKVGYKPLTASSHFNGMCSRIAGKMLNAER